MIFYVYEHWRLDKDECFYVGKGSAGRAYSRSQRNTHWKNIVKKLENNGFAYEVRIVSCNLSEKEAFELEQQRITFWKNIVDLSNQTDGGEGFSGGAHSEKSKEKISIKLMGNKNCLGRSLSEDQKKKISIGMIGKKNFLGKKHTEEANKKRSEANKNMYFSDEHKLKISASKKGKKFTVEHKEKLSLAKRKYWAKRKALKKEEEKCQQ